MPLPTGVDLREMAKAEVGGHLARLAVIPGDHLKVGGRSWLVRREAAAGGAHEGRAGDEGGGFPSSALAWAMERAR